MDATPNKTLPPEINLNEVRYILRLPMVLHRKTVDICQIKISLINSHRKQIMYVQISAYYKRKAKYIVSTNLDTVF